MVIPEPLSVRHLSCSYLRAWVVLMLYQGYFTEYKHIPTDCPIYVLFDFTIDDKLYVLVKCKSFIN